MGDSNAKQLTVDDDPSFFESLKGEKCSKIAQDRYLSNTQTFSESILPHRLREKSTDVWLHPSAKIPSDSVDNANDLLTTQNNCSNEGYVEAHPIDTAKSPGGNQKIGFQAEKLQDNTDQANLLRFVDIHEKEGGGGYGTMQAAFTNSVLPDTPPKWFLEYMEAFKRELLEKSVSRLDKIEKKIEKFATVLATNPLLRKQTAENGIGASNVSAETQNLIVCDSYLNTDGLIELGKPPASLDICPNSSAETHLDSENYDVKASPQENLKTGKPHQENLNEQVVAPEIGQDATVPEISDMEDQGLADSSITLESPQNQTDNTQLITPSQYLSKATMVTDDLAGGSKKNSLDSEKILSFLQVESPNSNEIIRLPLETDGSLLLTSLKRVIPDATGLTYYCKSTSSTKRLCLWEGKFLLPPDIFATENNIRIYKIIFDKGLPESDTDSDGSTTSTIQVEKETLTRSEDPSNPPEQLVANDTTTNAKPECKTMPNQSSNTDLPTQTTTGDFYNQKDLHAVSLDFFSQDVLKNTMSTQQAPELHDVGLPVIEEETTLQAILAKLSKIGDVHDAVILFDQRVNVSLNYIRENLNEISKDVAGIRGSYEKTPTIFLDKNVEANMHNFLDQHYGPKGHLGRSLAQCMNEISDLKTMIGSLQLNTSTNPASKTKFNATDTTTHTIAGQSYMPVEASTSHVDTDMDVEESDNDRIRSIHVAVLYEHAKKYSVNKIKSRLGKSTHDRADVGYALWVMTDKELDILFPKAHIIDVLMARKAKQMGTENAMKVFGFLK